METCEELSRSSSVSSTTAGFPVGRRNSYIVLNRKSNRFVKAKKHRAKGLISSMPWHAVFAFLNPLLIGLLQVQSQSTMDSPFKTHPANMWTFLLATVLYCLAFAANIKRRRLRSRYALFSRDVALISGSLSSVSLISIFLPGLLRQLIFFSWIIFSIVVLRQFIFCMCRWPRRWIAKASFRLHGIANMIMEYGRNNRQPQLPV